MAYISRWNAPSSACVYAICDGVKHHKIGMALDLRKRIKQLQTGCPTKLVLVGFLPCTNQACASKAEAAAHRYLSDCRAEGEWFECDSWTAMQAIYEGGFEAGIEELPVQLETVIDSNNQRAIHVY